MFTNIIEETSIDILCRCRGLKLGSGVGWRRANCQFWGAKKNFGLRNYI